jgi:hypothetical protein
MGRILPPVVLEITTLVFAIWSDILSNASGNIILHDRSHSLDTKQILTELRAELNRLNQAIAALESLDGTATATTPTGKAAPAHAKKRGLTPAGRRRLSAMMKARWEARRKQTVKPTSTKAGAHKPMSAATKKRLSLLAKRRWAARKKAAKAA